MSKQTKPAKPAKPAKSNHPCRGWQKVGSEAAKRLGYDAFSCSKELDLRLILKDLGGYIIPMSLEKRLKSKPAIPWLQVFGKENFTLLEYPDSHFERITSNITRALYYYIITSQAGKEPLKTDDGIGDDFYQAHDFVAGFLIPEKAFPKKKLNHTQTVTHLHSITGAEHKYIELRILTHAKRILPD